MSKKGGYKIVSLGGIDLLGEDLSLKGLYDALKVSYGKPILLTDINIDGEHKKDALVQANEGANKINIQNLYGYDLEVAKSGDAITVSPSAVGIELPVPTAEDDGSLVGVNVQGKYVLKQNPLGEATVSDNGKVLEVVNGNWAIGGKKVNVIDAPSNVTLTDEIIAIITGGVFMNGTLLNLQNPILTPCGGKGTRGAIIGRMQNGNLNIQPYYIGSDGTIALSASSKTIILDGIKSINGKELPSNPSDTGTFTLKCVDGVLTWVQDV